MKKYFELITIPVAVALLVAYNAVAGWLGLYTFTWEMFGKVFVAFLLFRFGGNIIGPLGASIVDKALAERN